MHVGGRVEWLLEPADPDELRRAYAAARERGFAPRILGGGANLIVADDLLPGVAISTARLRRIFRPSAPAGEDGELAPGARMAPLERERDPRLVAWCGATLPSLVRAAQELGWSGLEGLTGVPGSVGGGIAMNAGGGPGSTWDAVESIRVLAADGEFADLARADCKPGYRSGGLGQRVLVGAVFRFRPERPEVVRERMRSFLQEKRAKQPVTERSAGCVFRNPDPERSAGRSAGRLIEEVGGKGLARGDAVVSPLHANFIVNRGSARAADVLGLIDDLRELVLAKTGIRLATEVKIWRKEDPFELAELAPTDAERAGRAQWAVTRGRGDAARRPAPGTGWASRPRPAIPTRAATGEGSVGPPRVVGGGGGRTWGRGVFPELARRELQGSGTQSFARRWPRRPYRRLPGVLAEAILPTVFHRSPIGPPPRAPWPRTSAVLLFLAGPLCGSHRARRTGSSSRRAAQRVAKSPVEAGPACHDDVPRAATRRRPSRAAARGR